MDKVFSESIVHLDSNPKKLGVMLNNGTVLEAPLEFWVLAILRSLSGDAFTQVAHMLNHIQAEASKSHGLPQLPS